MDSFVLQNIRYKLQKRIRRLNSAKYDIFQYQLKQLFNFFKKNPIFQGVFDKLEAKYPKTLKEIEILFSKDSDDSLAFDDEEEMAAASYFVLRKCALLEDSMGIFHLSRRYGHASKYDESLDTFRDVFLDPFYEYIDEQLDDVGTIISLLIKFKQKCEWFQKDHLFSLWEKETQRGERKLTFELYEYLHDQGLNFSIEPRSVSGIADLVSLQIWGEPLIADAKIFSPEKSKGKDYLIKAFNQIYTYTRDYNQAFGYLIIFKTCEEDIKFLLPQNETLIPSVMFNNKTIFFLVIDIYPYEESASKRGTLKTYELTEDELFQKKAESL